MTRGRACKWELPARRPDALRKRCKICNRRWPQATPTSAARFTRCSLASFASWAASRKRKLLPPNPRGSLICFSSTAKSHLQRAPMITNRRGFLSRAAALIPLTAMNPFRWLGAPPSTAPIRLELAPASCGLDFALRNGAQGRKYQVEALPGGLGVIDFDGDGWPDLFCANGAALPSLTKTGREYWNRLFRNNRDGTFSDVTEKAGLAGQGYGMGVAVGDYNNDGHQDLFVVGVHGNQLYRNNG